MKKQMILMGAITLALTACGQGPETTAETGKTATEAVVATAPVAKKTTETDGMKLFGPCTGCHGLDGKKLALGVSVVIAGQSKDDLVTKIKGYKDGSYGGQMKASMTAMVANLNDDQITAVAEYISGL